MQYAYSKRRSEFGRPCYFAERPTEVLIEIVPDQDLHSQYIRINPVNRVSETVGSLSEHEASTEYIEMKDSGINHEEGGWPKDINASEIDHTNRYRKKLEKEESYSTQMPYLCKITEHFILQNNATNIYEEYFEDCDLLQNQSKTCAKNVVTLTDRETMSRPVCHLSWHPDGPEKVAVAHCLLDFQCQNPNMSTDSYIWRTDDMFNPDLVLHPSSPAVCIKYSPKDINLLAGGQYNGQVVFWDLRRSSFPTEKSALELSHHDPVYDVVWIQSKSGYECFSTSTDGKVMWWDLRNMKEPEDQMYLDPSKKDDVTRAQGGTCLEYDSTMPSKFLVGSESGNVFSCSRRSKTVGEKIVSVNPAHIGPIYALQRHPFYPKNYLTVGDWSAKIWSEDGRESPIIWTPKYCEYLTGGCWSVTRPSVFFVTKMDGTVDIWDLMYRMNAPEYSIKICDVPVYCISPQESGELVALGTKQGSVVILRLDKGLVELQRNERNLFVATVDRGIRREKILENREREKKLALKKTKEPNTDVSKKEESSHKIEESVEEVEKRFLEVVKKELKRLQQFQQKSVPSQALIKDSESGHSSIGGGGDSALPENVKTNRLVERPAPKKHSVIAESHAHDENHSDEAARRTSTSDRPATFAMADSIVAEPVTTAKYAATEEQLAVGEQSIAVEHSAVLGYVTMSEHLATSEKSPIAESAMAEPPAVLEHKATVEQSVIAEHLVPVDAAEHGQLVQKLLSENLSTASKHSAMAKEPHTIRPTQHSTSVEPEQPVEVEQPATIEHSNAGEHQSTNE